MARFLALALGLLVAIAAADNQKCDNTADNQECDGGVADEATLLAHSLIKKQRVLAASASVGAGTAAAGERGDSHRLGAGWYESVQTKGRCCFAMDACPETVPGSGELPGCNFAPPEDASGCSASEEACAMCGVASTSSSLFCPVTAEPEPGDTLEACLSAGGGSPFTYVGSQVNENSVKNIHNARITNSIKPSAVVFAQTVSEVVHAVSCAYKFNKPVYGRSGMNQYEASCADEEGGGAGCVLIDTNNMFQVDWASTGCQNGQSDCIAALGPGLSLGSAYVQLSYRNYTLPAGTCAQVRVAGLTLGGGKGFLTRKYGLTLDRLRGISAVLLDGTTVYAGKDSEPHLFWLARGGGGNIFPGVVTAFHFELVPVPESFLSVFKSWPLDSTSSYCRQQLLQNWYEKLAIDNDTDLFARLVIENFGSPVIRIEMNYYGSNKQGALDKLDSVHGDGCSQGSDPQINRDDSWVRFVQATNGNPPEKDLIKNNCGWLLARDGAGKPTATHSPCFGFDTSYQLFWAYRSLVFGKDKIVPDSFFNTLANVDVGRLNLYIELDPSNGVAATIPSDATAYPWRNPGYVTMQKVHRGDSRDIVQAEIHRSAEFMRKLTKNLPIKGYYNYLDKNMSSYGGVPRDAYYGRNADRVEKYLKEYTEGISPNGCARCDSWELRKP